MNSPSLPDPDEEWAKQEFPQIAGSFRKTSDKTPDYNCLAWAIGLTHPWIDPFGMGPGYGWPAGVPREWTVMAARQVLARYGYTEETINRELEPDWDKVAIYTKANGDLSHFARQLATGAWTSKLGSHIDIEHANLECLDGIHYGKATVLLKRKKQN